MAEADAPPVESAPVSQDVAGDVEELDIDSIPDDMPIVLIKSDAIDCILPLQGSIEVLGKICDEIEKGLVAELAEAVTWTVDPQYKALNEKLSVLRARAATMLEALDAVTDSVQDSFDVMYRNLRTAPANFMTSRATVTVSETHASSPPAETPATS